MRTTLYVGGFASNTAEEALRALFGEFGEIAELRMIRRQSSPRGLGFAYITFAAVEAAEAALSLNGRELGGLPLRVDFAR
ncbi:MAG: RNA-binding protein [Myxococcales bacterium]|nr:RNA-binding protein [Myxococcales bacterium]